MIDELVKVVADFSDYVLCEAGATVEHCHEDAFELEVGIGAVVLETLDEACYDGEAFHCIVFALHCDDDGVGGC